MGPWVMWMCSQVHWLSARAKRKFSISIRLCRLNLTTFGWKMICEIQRELESEIKHYCKVRKKYKRAHSISHGISLATANRSVFSLGSSVTTSLTGVCILVGAPLAGWSAVFGLVSAGSTALSRYLSRKKFKTRENNHARHEQAKFCQRTRFKGPERRQNFWPRV